MDAAVTFPNHVVENGGYFTVEAYGRQGRAAVFLPGGRLLDTYEEEAAAHAYADFMNRQLKIARESSKGLS